MTAFQHPKKQEIKKIFEGPWEEISAHAKAFKRCKIRRYVLPQETAALGHLIDKELLRETAMSL